MTTTNPRQITCPACNAQPGRPCTAPTANGRREVTWVHSSRTDEAEDWTPADRLPNAIEAIVRAAAPYTELRCNLCGYSAEVDEQNVRAVLEHAAFSHAGRADVLMVTSHVLAFGYEVALLLGATPATEGEERWRAERAEEVTTGPRYEWHDFEPDVSTDQIPGKEVLTIAEDGEEVAVIVHRNDPTLNNEQLKDAKRARAQRIVDALNASGVGDQLA